VRSTKSRLTSDSFDPPSARLARAFLRPLAYLMPTRIFWAGPIVFMPAPSFFEGNNK
jgi:hypothetical protein